LHPLREAGTGYRLYDVGELGRLNVVALLRDVGYRFDTIREVLDELGDGRPDEARRALEERLEALHRATWQCMAATSAVRDYLEKLSLAPPGV
jgi:DNA-binding transcriptional MerR regulator